MVIECSSRYQNNWDDIPELVIGNEIIVFKIQISRYVEYYPTLVSLLQPDEIVRANRYYQQEDRNRFVITRVALRILLGRYCGISPSEIIFSLGKNQKPSSTGIDGLCFNVSHAGDWALVAISQNEVGVDVEKINVDFNYQLIIEQVFSREEISQMRPEGIRPEAFFQAWTRKEAFAKATAQGIGDDFRLIPVSDGTNYLYADAAQHQEWKIISFTVQDSYLGALAFPVIQCAPAVIFSEFTIAELLVVLNGG